MGPRLSLWTPIALIGSLQFESLTVLLLLAVVCESLHHRTCLASYDSQEIGEYFSHVSGFTFTDVNVPR